MKWQRGHQLPPFHVGNDAVVQLVLELAVSTTTMPPKIEMSKAVAVQVYLLFQVACFRHLPSKCVYRVLAAVALGVLPTSIPEAAIKRLSRILYKKERGLHSASSPTFVSASRSVAAQQR